MEAARGGTDRAREGEGREEEEETVGGISLYGMGKER